MVDGDKSESEVWVEQTTDKTMAQIRSIIEQLVVSQRMEHNVRVEAERKVAQLHKLCVEALEREQRYVLPIYQDKNYIARLVLATGRVG